MSVIDFSTSLGMELIGKEAKVLLARELNGAIQVQDDAWSAVDDSLGFVPVRCEFIEPENFYYGHRPSLIEAPIERYPNCSALCDTATPNSADRSDQINAFDARLYVEVMCKSYDSEEEVNARAQRTGDAVHTVLMEYPVIGGAVVDRGNAPNVRLTDVFVRPEQSGHGRRFLWQGVRLEYNLLKYVSF